ncbi:MAG TPA: SprT family zinc-dependent metalloprotease [Burkholderiaceae bacterium]|nr:SprT family zinc-dependent metalloprotease [Burkholderiaceae bacterium]
MPSPLRSAQRAQQQLALFDENRAPTAAVADGSGDEPAPLAPVEFRHPEADREILLDGHRVAYALRRARRRSIGFVVSAEGLSVSAPRWVGASEIEAALQAKGGWILRKLHAQRTRAQRLLSNRIIWAEGASIPFLGESVTLVLDPKVAGAVLDTGTQEPAGRCLRTLRVGLPPHAAPDQIRDAVQSWLQRQARRVFEERCRHFADRLGVRVRRLSLSSAQTRWGSASADGSIRLHWRLVHFAMPTIDYVVAHELAHLREMNHSPAFWDVVRSVMPDFEQARGPLKDDVLPAFD